MTHTARYDAKQNVLVELPWMEKPEDEFYLGRHLIESLERDRAAYNAHLASLRTIPCHLSCKEVFIHDCDYQEGKDYRLQDDPCPYFDDINDPVEYTTYAYPVVAQVSEDDLWRELVTEILNNYMQHLYGGYITITEAISELKKNYIIQKR